MIKWLLSLFKGDPNVINENNPMKKFLIVGLGNIGDTYADTRHNIGFTVLDALAKAEDFTFNTVKLGDVGTFKHKGKSILCLKPNTFMNLSGKAVRYWLEKENIPVVNLLIITDDINLPFGTLRLKTKGSDGGHNGLKSIQNLLQTQQYPRLRFGVGADFGKGRQVDYVLGNWTTEESTALAERTERVVQLIRSFVFAGAKNTMNQFNGT